MLYFYKMAAHEQDDAFTPRLIAKNSHNANATKAFKIRVRFDLVAIVILVLTTL